jgi:endonuclease/exonuclease/phosphatase family metal-dependent hydrolase
MNTFNRTVAKLLACGTALLALVLIATGCHTPEAERPVKLKVMSYNIRIGAGGGAWSGDPSRINLEPVARVIAAHAPDIVGLQELDQFRKRSGGMDQPAWMADRLKMNVAFAPAFSVPSATGPDEHYGVGLLTWHRLLAHLRFPLFKPDYRQSHPEYPDYYSEQRVLLYTPVLLANRQVHVFVTHLGLTADQREQQLKQIAEITARYPGPKILLGDFNAEPDEPAMALLRQNFQDALEVAGTSQEERKSYPGGLQPARAIDYIFVSREFRVLNAHVIRDESLASDHNPVLAELELAP